MNVSLTVELEQWVQERVESGLYTSASEVVREALRMMREREALRRSAAADLRAELDIGLRQLDLGQGRPFDASAVAAVKRAGRARRDPRKP